MDAVLSDLFFMVDNKEYFSDTLDEESKEEALLENAAQFAFLATRLGKEVSTEEVVEDFKRRVYGNVTP